MEALRTKAGGLVAPDANGTLRVTYGRVAGVDAADGLTYRPQTTLAGILEKHTGEGEFAAPDRELEAIRALRGGRSSRYVDADLGDVPVDFLSTVDTTGGNSGSATLDAQGNLCGLLFDGTYDSVVADILYDGTKRSIHVDSRYLLWVLSEVEGATALLDELGHGARAATH
jgi:peptidase S46-like protein